MSVHPFLTLSLTHTRSHTLTTLTHTLSLAPDGNCAPCIGNKWEHAVVEEHDGKAQQPKPHVKELDVCKLDLLRRRFQVTSLQTSKARHQETKAVSHTNT